MSIVRVFISSFTASVLMAWQASALPNITIMADNSISLAVSRIARDYAREKNVVMSTSFVEKTQQSAQILQGSAADILITSDVRWIDDLQARGLIDVYSKMEFARGRLALVGPKDSPLQMKLTDNFMAAPLVHAMHSEPMLYIGNPEYVVEGRYAREALRNLRALHLLEPYTLYAKKNEEMVEQVTKYGAFGVFYYSQALMMENARIIDVFPESSHSPIIYYSVVIAGDNMDEARKLSKYFTSYDVRNMIRASGLMNGEN